MMARGEICRLRPPRKVIGEAMVIADLIRQGHDVAIPFGHNQPFDLIVIRKEDGRRRRFKSSTPLVTAKQFERQSAVRPRGWLIVTPQMRLTG